MTAESAREILLRIEFYGETQVPIKTLGGFVKGRHKVPSEANPSSQQYMATLCAQDVDDDIEDTFQRLRGSFGFKRRELSTDVEASRGSIATPSFDYAVVFGQDEDEPANMVCRRSVVNVTEAEVVASQAFDHCFSGTLDRFSYRFAETVNVEDVIDAIEDLEDAAISVDYDKDATSCTIRLAGKTQSITITATHLTISGGDHARPADLLELFRSVQERLATWLG